MWKTNFEQKKDSIHKKKFAAFNLTFVIGNEQTDFLFLIVFVFELAQQSGFILCLCDLYTIRKWKMNM